MNKAFLWYSTVLSIITSIIYILAGTGVFSDGLGGADENPPAVFYAAAAFYLVVGYLVHLKNKWVRLSLGIINVLIILIFFQMWFDAPEVLTSPAGLGTKIVQMLLEIGLIYLIIKTWKQNTKTTEPAAGL